METEAKRQRTPLAPPPAPLTEAVEQDAAVAAVFGNVDLLREILLLLDAAPYLVRAALVSKHWLGAAADPAFLRRFRARSPPRLLGFLATFSRRDVRFVPVPHPSELAGAARRVAAAFNGGGSSEQSVVADCRNGRVLMMVGGRDGITYSVISPLRSPPAALSVVGRPPFFHPAPGPPHTIKYDVLCTQLEVLPDPGADDIRDAVSGFGRTTLLRPRYHPTDHHMLHQEAKFLEQRVYVYVRQGGAWIAHVSPTLQIPIPLPVQLNGPYSLLVGSRLCMMTIVGCIVVFDMATETFSVIRFPGGVSCKVGILGHMFARAGDTGIYLVHVNGMELHIWLWRIDGEGGIWELVDTVSLPMVFSDHVAKQFWDSIRAMGSDSDYYVQIHAVGDNAEFVFLTVGKLGSVFLLDIKRRVIEKVLQTSRQNDGDLYGIFPFMMPWPLVLPPSNPRG